MVDDNASAKVNGCALTFAEYARHRGCSRAAVHKAANPNAKVARLKDSIVVVDGRRYIRNAAEADREWQRNTGRLASTRNGRRESPGAVAPVRPAGALSVAIGVDRISISEIAGLVLIATTDADGGIDMDGFCLPVTYTTARLISERLTQIGGTRND